MSSFTRGAWLSTRLPSVSAICHFPLCGCHHPSQPCQPFCAQWPVSQLLPPVLCRGLNWAARRDSALPCGGRGFLASLATDILSSLLAISLCTCEMDVKILPATPGEIIVCLQGHIPKSQDIKSYNSPNTHRVIQPHLSHPGRVLGIAG